MLEYLAYLALVIVVLGLAYEVRRLKKQMAAMSAAVLVTLDLLVKYADAGIAMTNEIESLRQGTGKPKPDWPSGPVN